MASLAKLIELSPEKLITVERPATKKKEAVTVQMRVFEMVDTLQEAFEQPEMAELINITGERKGHHRAVLNRAVANFEAMTTYEYRVHMEDGKTRRAFIRELDEPHEYLFSRTKLHAGSKLYKRYALVLWIATGYYGYATLAGYDIKYTRVGRDVVSNALDIAFANEKELLDAMAWWESADRRKDILDVLKIAQNHLKTIKYRDTKKDIPQPYIDWETAASAVLGMRMASGDSTRSARKVRFGKELRPDEKAQFIRDYIEAEKRMQGVVDSNSVREVKDLCLKFEKLSKQYPLFDTEKTHDIIATLRRSNFTRVTERQRAYLLRVVRDIEDYKEVKEKRKVGEDLFDVDKFFDSITGED